MTTTATIGIVNRLKSHFGGVSDYRVAKILGVRTQTVYKWTGGRGTMSDEIGIRAARLLGEDERKILLDLHIEREAGQETASIWQAIRDNLQTAVIPAAAVAAGVSGYLVALAGSPLA